MTQGYEANHSGRFLEGTLRRELGSRGFLFRSHGEDADNLDMFTQKIVVSNVPYISLYGCESRSEFVITMGFRKIRVECRWQESSGSVDEKFVYLLRNAVERMPEQEILILYGGNGARKEAVDWLKSEARKVSSKFIHVVNINDFLQWVRREINQYDPIKYDSRDDMNRNIQETLRVVRDRKTNGGSGWPDSKQIQE